MSETGLPPYPTSDDWKSWATQLVEFLSSQGRSEEQVVPRVVALLHQVGTDPYRAVQDGLVMYNPSSGTPLFSVSGEWKDFTYGTDALTWSVDYVSGDTYDANTIVLDYPWLMVSNTVTSDPAAPALAGDETYDITSPTWSTEDDTSVVRSGREWDVTAPISVIGVQVWVPEVTVDTKYSLLSYSGPTSDPTSRTGSINYGLTLTAGEWNTVTLDSAIVLSGTTFGYVLESINSSSDTTIAGDWARAANNNVSSADPGTGEWGTRNNESTLRVNYMDLAPASRETELKDVTAGSTVEIVQTSDATRSMRWTIESAGQDYTTHITFEDITYLGNGTGGEPEVGEDCDVSIVVPIANSTKYVEEVAANPTVAFGTARGVLEFDGVDQAGDADAFGVRILYDLYTTSDDWDVMGYVGVNGAGGSGGSAPPENVLATTGNTFPADPIDGNLHYLTVDPTGLYVYYVDANSSQWVQTNG